MLIQKSRRPPVIIKDNKQIKPNPRPWELKISRELLFGKVKILSRIGIEKIPFTRIFYRVFENHWALDPEGKCKLGDVVVIRKLPEEKMIASTVPYLVEKVVFEHGVRIDPISKKRNFEGIYADEMNFRKQLVEEIYNEPLDEKSFTYDKKRSLIKQRIRQKLNLLKTEEEN